MIRKTNKYARANVFRAGHDLVMSRAIRKIT